MTTTFLSIYALFGDDLRLALFDAQSDAVFDGITITALVLFFLELLAAGVAKEDYLWSSFFMLDFIASATLIFDITTVAEGFATMSSVGEGAQAARMLRVLRLVRLIRIVKVYKTYLEAQQRKKIRVLLEKKKKREREESGGQK